MRALGATLDTEKLARVPTVSLNGFTLHELDRQAYGVGLAIHLPVWNWNTGGIAQAQAKLSASRKLAEATLLQIEMAVIEAQSACQASVTAATRLGNGMVPRSETAASTMERTYQLGGGESTRSHRRTPHSARISAALLERARAGPNRL
jgi:outer membrane protein TolC